MLNRCCVSLSLAILCAVGMAGPLQAANFNVTLQTNAGDIVIELYQDTAPVEVANFMAYVNSGAYDSSFFHRLASGFVLQGGGYMLEGINIYSIPTNAPIADNYGTANVRGTLAYAKSSLPNSATSQFFINLADNTDALGPSGVDPNGVGYMVFGEVASGMDVVDAIASWDINPRLGSPFLELPYNDLNSDTYIQTDELAIIQTVHTPEPLSMVIMAAGIPILLKRRRKRC